MNTNNFTIFSDVGTLLTCVKETTLCFGWVFDEGATNRGKDYFELVPGNNVVFMGFGTERGVESDIPLWSRIYFLDPINGKASLVSLACNEEAIKEVFLKCFVPVSTNND